MPCIHKFAKDLHLARIDFQPVALIIGTFNPGWDNLGNTAEWFYGRTRNNYFWDVLPRLYSETPLRQSSPAEWKAFCKQYRIALTDLIASIDDADSNNPAHVGYLKNYRDDLIARHCKCINLVNIPSLLAKHPTIRHVYLTRSIADPFWRRLWQPIEDFCQYQEIKTQTLLTPSGSARFQIPKGAKISLGDFIFEQWQQQWHYLK
jgi:hypothetical protein